MANEILDVITVFFTLVRWNITPIFEELSNTQNINYIRLITAVFAGSSSAGFLVVYFKDKIRQAPLLFCRKHVILCGQNDTSTTLVKELAAKGKKSVVITSRDGRPETADIRRYATVVLNGNAKDPAVLSLARVKSAGALLAFTDSDGLNAEIALSAMNVLQHRNRSPLPCIIEIHNPGLWRIIREKVLVQERENPIRLDFFNGPAIAARVLLGTHFSPTLDMWVETPSLLVVVGAGKLGESIIIRASREWFEYASKGGRILKVVLIDFQASEIRDRLFATYPLLRNTVEITPISIDVQTAEFQTSSYFEEFRRYERVLAFICLNDDTAGLSAALTLSHNLAGVQASILVRMDHNPGLAKLVGERDTGNQHIIPFSSLAIASQSDLVLGGIREILAKAIHDEFLASRSQVTPGDEPDTTPDPGLSPWEFLPERLKESNRRQAENIMNKLASIGCDIMPMTDWNAPNFSFSHNEIESLAEMEHVRWMNEMLSDGYSFGPKKDDQRKTHPCILPYSDLPENEKEKDRKTVRMIPKYLGLIDFQIYRITDKSNRRGENHVS